MISHLNFLLLIGVGLSAATAIKNFRHRPMLDGRIVGGSRINVTDAPYQVSLSRSGFHFCGGSIINESWVLTAAHCTDSFKDELVPSLKVRVGTSKRDLEGKLIDVKKIIQHEKFFMSTIDYDFSLLQLANDIPFDDTMKPIGLPEQFQAYDDGMMCTVSGWGNTQSAVENDNWLRETKVPLVNEKMCKEAYNGFGGITNRMICAGYPEGQKDACQGDSGGPLASNGTLVGIVSWGYGCAKPNFPGVYSRVAFIRHWIKEKSGV